MRITACDLISLPLEYKQRLFILSTNKLMFNLMLRRPRPMIATLLVILGLMGLIFFFVVYLVPDDSVFLENPAGDYLGRVSYSLYLLHVPVLALVAKVGLTTPLNDLPKLFRSLVREGSGGEVTSVGHVGRRLEKFLG